VRRVQRKTQRKDVNAGIDPKTLRVTVHRIADITTPDKIQV